MTDLLEKALNLTQKAFSVYMMQVRAAKDGAPVKAVSLKSTSFHLDAKATARLASRMNDLGLGVNGVTREDLLLAAFRIGGDALQDETTSAAEYRDADNAQVALRSGPLWAQALPTASSG